MGWKELIGERLTGSQLQKQRGLPLKKKTKERVTDEKVNPQERKHFIHCNDLLGSMTSERKGKSMYDVHAYVSVSPSLAL